MATFEELQEAIHESEGNIVNNIQLAIEALKKHHNLVCELNDYTEYITPNGKQATFIGEAIEQIANIGKAFNNSPNIMPLTTCHDRDLVERINECYDDIAKRTDFCKILHTLACKYHDEVTDKLNLTTTKLLNLSPQRFTDLYGQEMFIEVLDDKDLQTILCYCHF